MWDLIVSVPDNCLSFYFPWLVGQCCIDGLIHWDSTVFEVHPKEAEGSMSLSNDLLNMSSPGKIRGKIIQDGDSQVFA